MANCSLLLLIETMAMLYSVWVTELSMDIPVLMPAAFVIGQHDPALPLPCLLYTNRGSQRIREGLVMY
ncbi:MAG: hypothetical protein EBR73_08885 [Rhodobacteraceae bacterium]|nr:hypothetical protein [Paracoccaceae bacterium]